MFLSRNDENLCEIAPLLGDRLKIKRLISETLTKLDTVSGWVLPVYLRTDPFFTHSLLAAHHLIPPQLLQARSILLHHPFHGHGCVHVERDGVDCPFCGDIDVDAHIPPNTT